MIKVMITGHKTERLNGREQEIKDWITKTLKSLGPSNTYNFTGMARGTDILFAEVVKEMGLPLVCAFPYKHPMSEVEQTFIDYAEQVYFQSEKKYDGCYADRDKWMVDHSDVVLVVWDGVPKGGAYDTMQYAEDETKTVIMFPWEKK